MNRILVFAFTFFGLMVYGQDDLMLKGQEHIYSNQDSAYYYLDELYKKSVLNKEWLTAVEALTLSNQASSYHNNLIKFGQSLEKEEKLIEKLPDSMDYLSDGPTYYRNRYLHDKGRYYYRLNNYAKAAPYYFEMLNILEKMPDSVLLDYYTSFVTTANSYLATMYQYEFKYGIAEEFYNENLILHKKFGHNETRVLQTKNLVAALKSEQEDYGVSNRMAKESITYYLNNSPENNLNSLISTTLLLVNNYLKLKQPDSAQMYLEKIEAYVPKRKSFQTDFKTAKANVYVLMENDELALKEFGEIIEELKSEPDGGDDIALVYRDLGDLYTMRSKFKTGLEFYKRALGLFQNGKSNKTSKVILPLAKRKTNYFRIVNAYCGALLKSDLRSANDSIIAMAMNTIKELELFKRTFYEDSDKQVLVENLLPIFEDGIEASYRLYNDQGNESFVDSAFAFFENSKSSILLDAISKNHAARFSGIPDNLLERERILKISISDLEKQIQLNDVEENSRLLRLKREHEELISSLETNHPAYYSLKYETKTSNIEQFQNDLDDDQGAISYFFGENALYAIAITNQDKKLFKITYSGEDIKTLMELQKQFSMPTGTIEELNQISHRVYAKFVAPCLIDSSIKTLYIMPDGILRTFPFGALNTLEHSTEYLIEKMDVVYVNSATHASKLFGKVKNKPTLLAFAPSFDSIENVNENGFSPLPNNKKEVEQINAFFHGNAFVGTDATLQMFKDKIKGNTIFHFATHAVTNDNFPEYSFLAFTPAKDQEYVMYVNDLYATELNADLVTLSACETGVGQLKKGEGILSLSRAFFYAGASSIAHTLWKVNDNASSQVMTDFYKYLSEGKTKDAALRMAKLNFLKKNKENNLRHPYYWAGIIFSGNTAPLVHGGYGKWYILAIALIIFILFLYRKKLFQFFK